MLYPYSPTFLASPNPKIIGDFQKGGGLEMTNNKQKWGLTHRKAVAWYQLWAVQFGHKWAWGRSKIVFSCWCFTCFQHVCLICPFEAVISTIWRQPSLLKCLMKPTNRVSNHVCFFRDFVLPVKYQEKLGVAKVWACRRIRVTHSSRSISPIWCAVFFRMIVLGPNKKTKDTTIFWVVGKLYWKFTTTIQQNWLL